MQYRLRHVALVNAFFVSLILYFGRSPSFARPSLSINGLYLRQADDNWNVTIAVARLQADDDMTSDFVIQTNVLNKPQTTYANVIYQVFATRSGRWDEIYTNTGARLVFNEAGGVLLPPEIISIEDLHDGLEERFASAAQLEDYDIRVLVTIRYDAITGERDQQIQFEQEAAYDVIAQTTTPNLFAQDSPKR